MYVSRRQTAAMVLLVTLPLCVSALTAAGLLQLDRVLRNVSEEYTEVRMLEPIDRNLSMASLALESEDSSFQGKAGRYLQDAETGLVQYLASQYKSVATPEHQATEANEASELLRQLQSLTAGAADGKALRERRADVVRIHLGLEELHLAADNGVRDAHRAARRARTATLWLVIGASVVSTSACATLLIWSTLSINRRLRELHHRLATHTPGASTQTARGIGGVVSQIEDLNSRMLRKIEEDGRELLRRERLVGIGLLAADVAHEINNPMNAMLGLSELAMKSLNRGPVDEATRTEMQESLRVVCREAVRCKGIVERLMAMVRSDRKPCWFDAGRLVQETVRVAQAARPDRAPCFVITGESVSVNAYAPPNEVRQILLTLLINAADAVGADGRIEADVTNTEQEVWLRVRDNGCGFTEAMRQTFFRPFQTYSEGDRGVGLGLSIAQALAEGMGATLEPYSDGPGRGSLFVLAIPAPQGAS